MSTTFKSSITFAESKKEFKKLPFVFDSNFQGEKNDWHGRVVPLAENNTVYICWSNDKIASIMVLQEYTFQESQLLLQKSTLFNMER